MRVADVGSAQDAQQIQTNIVRVDGQPSVYLPVLKQGGNTNTISVVEGVNDAISRLLDVPAQLVTRVVFDQSQFVKGAIRTLLIAIGVRTGADLGDCAAVPVEPAGDGGRAALGAAVGAGGVPGALARGRLDQHDGAGRAGTGLHAAPVQFARRAGEHLPPPGAGRTAGGRRPSGAAREVAMPVLAATLTTIVVFFPVTFLFGVSRFLFGALAIVVVLALLASYVVALTVVPLFCARFLAATRRQPAVRAMAGRGSAAGRSECCQPSFPVVRAGGRLGRCPARSSRCSRSPSSSRPACPCTDSFESRSFRAPMRASSSST